MRSPQSAPWRPAPPGQRRQTVGSYHDDWLAGKARLRASTRRTYAEHIRLYLTPALGHLRLDQLDAVDIERMYTATRGLGASTGRAPGPEVKAMLAARQRSQPTRPLTAARLRRIHTTLMSTLNPASYVELDTGRRPKAVVWTEQREAHWRATGERPKVAVWLPSQTGTFLDHAEPHRLYALLHLIAFRGLRRGEAVGLRWTEVDLEQATLTVSGQDPPARRPPGDRRTQERERRANRRAGRRHRRRPAAAPGSPARGAAAVGSGLDRHRSGVHCRGRHRTGARPRLPAVRPPAQGSRPPAGPAARPAPRRRDPRAGRRREPEGGVGDARPLHDRDHRRHLHQRATRGRPRSRRSRRPAGAPRDVDATQRPHIVPIWRSRTATQRVAGDETARQRRAWDSNPRNEFPRSAVFKTAAIGH